MDKQLINDCSQNKQQLIFVYIDDSNRDNNTNQLMTRAFEALSARKFNTVWMKSSEIMDIESNSYHNYVFIMESFSGDVYNDLVRNKARIIGPLVVLYCVQFNYSDIMCSLLRSEPTYSHCMHGLNICVYGFDADKQYELIRMVRQMGAKFFKHLTKDVTHLVSDTILIEENFVALKQSTIKVLCSEWVYKCWEIFQYELINADNITGRYKLPIFNGLFVFATFESQDLNEIEEIVQSNGGYFYNSINYDLIDIVSKNEAIVLVNESCDDIEAQNHGLKCVNVCWLYCSLKFGYALPINDFVVSRKTENNSLNNSNEQINISGDLRQSNNGMQLNVTCVNFMVDCSIHAIGFNSSVTDFIRSSVASHGAVFAHHFGFAVTHVIVKENIEQSLIEKLRENALFEVSKCKLVSIEWLCECLETKSIVSCNEFEINIQNNKRKAQNLDIPQNMVLPKKICEALDKHKKLFGIDNSMINKSIAEIRRYEQVAPIRWVDDILTPNSEIDFEMVSQNTDSDVIECVDTSGTSHDRNYNIIRGHNETAVRIYKQALFNACENNNLLIITIHGYDELKQRELTEVLLDLNAEIIHDWINDVNNDTHLILRNIDDFITEQILSAFAISAESELIDISKYMANRLF